MHADPARRRARLVRAIGGGFLLAGATVGLLRAVLLGGVSGWSHAALALALAAAAAVDLRTGLLPDRLVAIAAAAAVVRAAAGGWASLAASAAGAAVVMAVVMAVMVVARGVAFGGVGGGDVKLAVVVGLACGPHGAALALVVAAAFGLLMGSVTRRSAVAFGPALWLGWTAAESFETLTAPAFRPPSVSIYTACCVASAELLQRASRTLGGGLWE